MRVRQSLSLRSHSRSGIGSNNVAMGTTLGSYGVALARLHNVAVEVDQHEVVGLDALEADGGRRPDEDEVRVRHTRAHVSLVRANAGGAALRLHDK